VLLALVALVALEEFVVALKWPESRRGSGYGRGKPSNDLPVDCGVDDQRLGASFTCGLVAGGGGSKAVAAQELVRHSRE